MHTINLIYDAIGIQPDEDGVLGKTEKGICCITGQESDCIDRKHLLSRSFTEQHLLKSPESQLVSVAAYTVLKYKDERMSSWICDGKSFTKLDRKEVRKLVIGGVESNRWAGYITTSYKKHGAMRAPLNSGNRQVWLFEMLVVDCGDREKLAEWWMALNVYLRKGIGRQSMESLDVPPFVMKKIGIPVWTEFHSWAKEKFESPLYRLLCYLLPSQEELKEEGWSLPESEKTGSNTESSKSKSPQLGVQTELFK